MDNKYDVIVVGGGMAGVSAAIASARNGAKTLLIEHYGFLGGWASAALVNPFMSHKTSDNKLLIAGIFQEILQSLSNKNGLLENCFDPDILKVVLDEMVLESGADIRFHTTVVNAQNQSNDEVYIQTHSKSGFEDWTCKILIDTTGDGDVCVKLGAEYETGDKNNKPQSATYMFDMGGVDIETALEYVKNNPVEMRFPKIDKNDDIHELSNKVFAVAGYYKQVELAKHNNQYNVPGDLVFYISRPIKGQVSFNTTHIGNINGTNSDDLTKAEIEGRKQMMEIVNFAVKYLPGFENAYLLKSAVQVGIRETRRIIGEYIFSEDDVANARKFDDGIARLAYYVDIHSGSGEGYTKSEGKRKLVGPPEGDWYDIPFRCLIPKNINNTLMAGRCVSSTQAGHGAIRIMPSCSAMGQAVGTAAAICISKNIRINDLNYFEIRSALASGGAIV